MDGKLELRQLLTCHEEALDRWLKAALELPLNPSREGQRDELVEELALARSVLSESLDASRLQEHARNLERLLEKWAALRRPAQVSGIPQVEALVRAVVRFRHQALSEPDLEEAAARFLSWHRGRPLPSELDSALLVSEDRRAARLLESALRKRDLDLLDEATRRLSRTTAELEAGPGESLPPDPRCLVLEALEELREERLTEPELVTSLGGLSGELDELLARCPAGDLESALLSYARAGAGGPGWTSRPGTPLESCSNLLEKVRSYFAGHAESHEVESALTDFEVEIDAMYQEFHRERCFRLDDPTLHEEAGEVYEVYRLLYEGLDQLHFALERELDRSALRAVALIGELVEQIVELYARIRDRSPQPSEAPYVDELLRVARACLAGQLGQDALQLRLEAFIPLFQAFVQDVESGALSLSPAQHEATCQAIQLLENGLLGLESYLHGEESDPPLEDIRRGSELLLGLQAERAAAPEALDCPRCGAGNSRGWKACQSCGALLPRDPSWGPGPGASLHHDEPTRPLAHLQELVQSTAAGTIGSEKLLSLLEEMRSRSLVAGRQLQSLGQVPQGLEPELEACLLEARAVLEDGQARFAELLESMLSCASSGDYAGLEPLYEELTDVCRSLERVADLNATARQVGSTP